MGPRESSCSPLAINSTHRDEAVTFGKHNLSSPYQSPAPSVNPSYPCTFQEKAEGALWSAPLFHLPPCAVRIGGMCGSPVATLKVTRLHCPPLCWREEHRWQTAEALLLHQSSHDRDMFMWQELRVDWVQVKQISPTELHQLCLCLCLCQKDTAQALLHKPFNRYFLCKIRNGFVRFWYSC